MTNRVSSLIVTQLTQIRFTIIIELSLFVMIPNLPLEFLGTDGFRCFQEISLPTKVKTPFFMCFTWTDRTRSLVSVIVSYNPSRVLQWYRSYFSGFYLLPLLPGSGFFFLITLRKFVLHEY